MTWADVDSPESDQPFGDDAKAFTSAQCLDQKVGVTDRGPFPVGSKNSDERKMLEIKAIERGSVHESRPKSAAVHLTQAEQPGGVVAKRTTRQ